MSDFVLLDGDKVEFLPMFGAAIVAVKPGALTGSGPATVNGKKVCVAGDEAQVAVAGCTYMTPLFSLPGSGTLKIGSLAGNQQATKSHSGDKAVLLKGALFTASFEVQSPAKQPVPPPASPIPDPTPTYSGQGMFETTNTKFRAT